MHPLCQNPLIIQLDTSMVYVTGGTFMMGIHDTSGVEWYADQIPLHKVTLKGFYISKYLVTQQLWTSVMDSNHSYQKNCNQCPVEYVSYFDVTKFINIINKLTGLKYRLPTEAEFEYAARGGIRSKDYNYSGSNKEKEVAWFVDNSLYTTHPIAIKQSNELGLYDMSGNVSEWCSDWYDESYYKNSSDFDPEGPANGFKKVVRGGSFLNLDDGCRVACRGSMPPWLKDRYTGFRLVRDL